MTAGRYRVAIVFPADPNQQHPTKLDQSRLSGVADALGAAEIEVVGAPFADELADKVRAQLREVDGVLVWFNPIEGGRDRSVLNAVLRDIASAGVLVSAHPKVIETIGTKEVLYRTRNMSWGSDTRLYTDFEAMRSELSECLSSAVPRVLKRIRGQSGDGVWKVELADPASAAVISPQTVLRVRHAKRGSVEQSMSLEEFLALCRSYFSSAGGMVDQPYQSRLPEGMVRCYVVGDRVAGFGEQLINALYPAPQGAASIDAPQPGPRLYYPPTRPDFQLLKEKLEHEWIPELCSLVGLDRSELPIIWDADFLYGPRDVNGTDSYVLCEINVSSVYPFPPSALGPIVSETMARIERVRASGPGGEP